MARARKVWRQGSDEYRRSYRGGVHTNVPKTGDSNSDSDGSSGSGGGNMSAEELIKNGKAKDGDTVRLLWRNELTTPFSDGICFGEDGKAISGCCIATRMKGGWALVDHGGEGGKGHDVWQAMDDDESECLENAFSEDGCSVQFEFG